MAKTAKTSLSPAGIPEACSQHGVSWNVGCGARRTQNAAIPVCLKIMLVESFQQRFPRKRATKVMDHAVANNSVAAYPNCSAMCRFEIWRFWDRQCC